MFVLQKIVARFFFPLPIVFWLLALALLVWRVRRDRRRWQRGRDRLAWGLAAAAVVWLFLISWDPVGDALLGTLERRHAPLAEVPAGITHVVVLGGGAHHDGERHSATRLTRSSQGRVLEGVRLFVTGERERGIAGDRSGAESARLNLVFTGDSLDDRRSMASLAAQTARELGVPAERITSLEDTLNTAQEAAAVRVLLLGAGGAAAGEPGVGEPGAGPPPRIVLVTSAAHMPRAIALFRRAGLDPVAAPAQFLTDPGGRTSWSFFPNAGALARTEGFFYEVLGLLWMRVRGGVL